jgi:hypothetical protein
MPTTPKLGLVNVLEGENFDIDVYNGNNDKVDAFAGRQPKKTTLYANANGTSGTIALNDTLSNYSYIIVDFSGATGTSSYSGRQKNGSMLLNDPNGKTCSLTIWHRPTASTAQVFSTEFSFSGTSVTNVDHWFGNFGSVTEVSPFNGILITKIDGYKY